MYNKDIKPKLRKLINKFGGQCKLSVEYSLRYPDEQLPQGTISWTINHGCNDKTADKINKLYNEVFG